MNSDPTPEPIDRRRLVLSLLGMVLFIPLCMLLPAGNWAWARGWIFILVYSALLLVASVYLRQVNPDLFAARINRHAGTKLWDAILLGFLLLSFAAILVVAALDDGRFHWFRLPWAVCIVGYVLLVVGVALFAWAEAVNKFFEPTVRIQTDRGHRVIDTGPYAFVRHPGYVACLPMTSGMALSLGSVWAVIPAVACCLILVLRTRWEDQTLQAELAGYKEFAQRVRYKWIPGVW